MNKITQTKTVLVTGATGAIGSQIVRSLSKQGARVIACGRNEQRLTHLGEIAGVIPVRLDMSKPASLEDAARDVENRFPELETVIQCSGIQKYVDLLSHTNPVAALRQEMEVNLVGTLHLTLRLLPLLLANRGTLVHTGTLLQYAPKQNHGAYSASKAGLHMYTDYLRRTFKGSLRVVEFIPPALATGLSGREVDATGVQACVETLLKDLEGSRTSSRSGIGRIYPLLLRLFPNYIFDKTWES